jgi:hypothetical protein
MSYTLPAPIPASPYGGAASESSGPLRNVFQPPSWIGRRVFPVTVLLSGATFVLAGAVPALVVGALHYLAMQSV